MITRHLKHPDRPNEVGVYLTGDQFAAINTALAKSGMARRLDELPEERRRGYCRSILDLTRYGESERIFVDLGSNVRLDSDELGRDLVRRFATPQDPDLFDPDYVPVDFNFYVLGEDGQRTVDDFLAQPSIANSERFERVLGAARLIVAFSFTPPNLA
jgi:hypothetical protein